MYSCVSCTGDCVSQFLCCFAHPYPCSLFAHPYPCSLLLLLMFILTFIFILKNFLDCQVISGQDLESFICVTGRGMVDGTFDKVELSCMLDFHSRFLSICQCLLCHSSIPWLVNPSISYVCCGLVCGDLERGKGKGDKVQFLVSISAHFLALCFSVMFSLLCLVFCI